MVKPLEESDYADLIGAPYVKNGRSVYGIDCWGIVKVICQRRGIIVPDPESTLDHEQTQAITPDDLPGWSAVKPGDEKPGDVAAYSFGGHVVDHVGVLLDSGLVLHSREKTGCVALGKRSYRTKFQGWWRPGAGRVAVAQDVIGDTSSEFVVVRLYRSALDPQDFTTHVCKWDGGLVCEYLPADLDLSSAVVSINGGRLSVDSVGRYKPRRGDLVEVVAIPGVTGAALAGVAAGTSVSFGFTLAAFFINSLISIGLSFLLKALTAPPKPSKDEAPVDNSPTFSQVGIRNTIAAGGIIPLVIGKHRVGGQIIGTFNSISELEVANFPPPQTSSPNPFSPPSPVTQGGQFDLIQNHNNASATGGKTTLNLLIAVSEGEIESINGLSGENNDVDAKTLAADTLLINGNQASEFTDIKMSTRMGTAGQSLIPGFGDTVSAVGVEINLKYQEPWNYTTTDEVDAFAVQLFEPQGHFRISGSQGQTKIKHVFYQFKYRPQGATAWTFDQQIERTYLNKAAHSWELRVDGLARGIWEISLERMTVDDDDASLVAAGSRTDASLAQINAVNEITYSASAHPGIALVAVKALATDQLSGTPTVTSIVEGKKWWVWDGVDPDAPDFTFKYTRNAGELLPGLLLNKNFGLGHHIEPQQIDYQAFADLATYCDETISDGRGGTMSRWRTDMVYDVGEKSGDIIDKILATCRASLVPVAGKISCKIHKAKSPTHLFSEGNVTGVKLGYVDTSARPSRINVTFANEELNYDLDTVSVEDQSITDGEFIDDTITVIGVTKPARAMRIGQHRLNVAGLKKTLEFIGALDSVLISPGDVFWFSHSNLSTGHVGGRLVDATATTVKLDRDIDVVGGQTYTLKVMESSTGAVTIESVTVSPSTTMTITAGTGILTSGFTNTPKAGDVYAWGLSSDVVEAFECIECPLTDELQRHVKAIEYDSTVYDDDPGTVPTATDELFDERLFPAKVTGLTITEEVRINRGTLQHRLIVAWRPAQDFERAKVFVRYPDETTAWAFAGCGCGGRFELSDFARDSVIEVSVVPISKGGNAQAPEFGATARLAIRGDMSRPDNISSLTAVDADQGVLLRWTKPETWNISHYVVKVGDNWAGGFEVGRASANDSSIIIDRAFYAAGAQTFMVKSVSKSGIEAQDAATVIFTASNRNTTLDTDTGETGWKGTKTNFTVSGGELLSDAALTASYITENIDAGKIRDFYVSTLPAVSFKDRIARTWANADFLWGSQGGRVRDWAGSDFTDAPDDYESAAKANWNNAVASWVSQETSGRTWAGIVEDAITVEAKTRAANTTSDLSAADFVDHAHMIVNGRYADAQIAISVPHTDYQARVATMETNALTPSAPEPQRFPRYIAVRNNVSSSTFTTTLTKANFDTVAAGTGDFSLASNQITINFTPESGYVKITFGVVGWIDTDAVTEALYDVYQNGVRVKGLRAKLTMNNASQNEQTGSKTFIVAATSGDVFDLRGKRSSGTASVKYPAQTAEMIIEEVLEER